MRTILIFEADEQEGAVLAQQAPDWYGIACELDEWLRTEIKHGGRSELQPARDHLRDLIVERGLNLYP